MSTDGTGKGIASSVYPYTGHLPLFCTSKKTDDRTARLYESRSDQDMSVYSEVWLRFETPVNMGRDLWYLACHDVLACSDIIN